MQPFQIGFFCLVLCIEGFIMSYRGLIAHFSLALNNIPLSGWTTGDLSIPLLNDILVASKF